MKRLIFALWLIAAAGPAAAQEVLPVPWAREQPNPSDFRNTYPVGALAEGVSGDVRLLCTITDEYKLDCAVHSETPAGYGFGDAALRLSRLYVASPDDPRIAVGGRVLLPIRYEMRD
ncbi:MAG: hypothetical protein JNM59_12565 [Hyphomonadaceae bacterium]|nr:hypothetical protein [Hyphomonadaceae bacterium]